jgi:hypothetical protein
MLTGGANPAMFKQRITGPAGHLADIEAAELLAGAGQKLQWACLADLSEKNNQPKVARQTHRQVLRDRFPIHVASRYKASGALEDEAEFLPVSPRFCPHHIANSQNRCGAAKVRPA